MTVQYKGRKIGG